MSSRVSSVIMIIAVCIQQIHEVKMLEKSSRKLLQ